MRGYENFNFDQFELTAGYLRQVGWTVISPHDIDINEHFVVATYNFRGLFENVELTPKFSIEKALRRDFTAICQECSAIGLMEGWENSDGARKELDVAKWVGCEVFAVGPDHVAPYTWFDAVEEARIAETGI